MAARDTGWAHTRLVGNRDLARSHVPDARKLLGYVREQAAYLKLATYQATKTLDDGTVITAEIRGTIPRITIESPGGGDEPALKPLLSDFVVWPRNAALPDGIDLDHPQLFLRPGEAARAPWTTYFWDAEIAGYDAFAGKKSTYRFAQGLEVFPEGARQAGNVDWCDEAGVRISWYGPSSRYFPDAFVQLRAQYGKFVFMLGQPVLDTDAYLADSLEDPGFTDLWIMGAALRRISGQMWLYTVQSEALDNATPTDSVDPGGGFVSPPNATVQFNSRVHRYRVSLPPPGTYPRAYAVEPNSRQLLGTISNTQGEPWFFSPDATTAHSILHAVTLSGVAYYARVFNPDLPPATIATYGLTEQMPTASQQIIRLAFNDAGAAGLAGIEALSVAPGGAPVLMARDYRRNGTQVDLALEWSAEQVPSMVLGQARFPLFEVTREGDDLVSVRRFLLAADLREGALVFLTQRLRFTEDEFDGETAGNTNRGDVSIEVVRAAAVEAEDIVLETPQIPELFFPFSVTPAPEKTDAFVGVGVAPWFFIYGITINIRAAIVGDYVQNFDIPSAAATYAWLGYPAAAYFGAFTRRNNGGAPITAESVASRALGGFSGSAEDFDGNTSITGMGATERAMVLSCSIPSDDGGRSYAYATQNDMAALTGVAGDNPRYHPVWILGNLPQEA